MSLTAVTLLWPRGDDEHPSLVRAIKVVRWLGGQQPGAPAFYGLRESKQIVDLMRHDNQPVTFVLPDYVADLVVSGLADEFVVVDERGVRADEIYVTTGLQRLEQHANSDTHS